MQEKCKTIVFSDKAYNAIIDETFKKEPVETGGILLGHILEGGYWIVMEVLPPGISALHETALFKPDDEFIQYMAESVSTKYEISLIVLGLWHRHPGSMDFFSSTDDATNLRFAQLNSSYGALSALVNVDPNFRLTMRHVSSPLHYEKVTFEVGDDLIPEEYFKLSHYPAKGMHPKPDRTATVLQAIRQQQQPYNQRLQAEQKTNRPYQQTYQTGQHTGQPYQQQQKDTAKKPVRCILLSMLAGFAIAAILFLAYTKCCQKGADTEKAPQQTITTGDAKPDMSTTFPTPPNDNKPK